MNRPPVRIAVFCSGSASSFRYLYENDQNCGTLYEFVGVFSDKPGVMGLEYAKAKGIPTAALDYSAWCGERGVRRSDLAARKEYFNKVVPFLAQWNAEAIMLSGCMLLITEPLLSMFEGYMLNVHPALLSLVDEEGKRKYTGLNVVARAIQAGDPTGSTVHIVTKEADMGPIVAESSALPYSVGTDPDEHQELMKKMCDGPAFATALSRLIRDGWPQRPWQVR